MDPGKEKRESPSSLGEREKNGKEDGKREFPLGMLAHLEMLEFRAHREAVEQEEKERREEKSAFLNSKIRELRLQRDQLREKLELLEKALGKEGIPSDPALPDPREVLEWKIRNLRELLQVFQLTGISGKLSKHGISFSFHTAFEGSFLDRFHLELLVRPESREFRIQRHSIPPFIPLEQLARKFLPSDLRGFLDVLFQHLNAFVGRRHQLEQFQEEFSDGIFQRSSLTEKDFPMEFSAGIFLKEGVFLKNFPTGFPHEGVSQWNSLMGREFSNGIFRWNFPKEFSNGIPSLKEFSKGIFQWNFPTEFPHGKDFPMEFSNGIF
ncbi:PREDICTED: centromere protein O [Corvus brachyrhynchos]|uniref:centromere protein O n=1 Tax=Corvus brachyrhynchos TaxID=85066 RepID=UPI0008166DFF|nr:PREDICTED: centromere protein O [Corvus brachyrhynchos]